MVQRDAIYPNPKSNLEMFNSAFGNFMFSLRIEGGAIVMPYGKI
ncbi:hypothetical protein [Aestuariivivens insulae]|nr:hypothetical protein [Aestuariivivens insulae]